MGVGGGGVGVLEQCWESFSCRCLDLYERSVLFVV